MKTIFQHLRKRHRSFRTNESGQALLMVAIFALSLLTITLSVIPVGQAITNRIQLQTAADHAALSAATWMARGANIHQLINGVHFDFDSYIQIRIGTVCDEWIAKLASDTARCGRTIPDLAACMRIVPFFGSDWTKSKKEVKKYIEKHKSVAPQFTRMHKTVSTLTPTLAFINANAVAKENGADGLHALADAELLHKLGISSLVGEAIRLVESAFSLLGVDLVTTTLHPSLNPVSSLQISRAVTPKSKDYCGRSSCSYNAHWMSTCIQCASPPVMMPIWTPAFSWQDTYYLSENLETPITFIIAREPQPSFVLNTLFLRDEDIKRGITNLLPTSIAIAAAEVYNDKLYPAGTKSMTYQPIGVSLITWPLPYSRFLFGNVYGGKFKARLCPVKIAGVDPFTSKLIYH